MSNTIEIIDGEARQEQYRLSEPINIAIGKGEHVAIIGDNGSGKSIVVGAMTGAIPLKGIGTRYNFGEGRSTKASENIKHLTFRDSYGTADRGYYHQQRWNSFDREGQPLVREMLPMDGDTSIRTILFDLFKIDSMLSKEMILLSSGELRKFQLTKAILSAPTILILEDPFIGLDATTRIQLNEILDRIVTKTSLQLIIVLSRDSDIPSFITNIIEIESGRCCPKLSYEEFTANKTKRPEEIKLLSEEKRQQILSMEVAPTTHNSPSIVELHNISIKYGRHTLLNELSWELKRGERWALSGENGAGKSTLLSLICADIPQGYACDITLFGRKRGSGESIWDIKRHIGYVSPEMHRAYCTSASCIEIVASGLHDTVGLYKRMKEEQREICQFWMDIFGIGELHNRDFMKISSGEQRLVLLARAFVKDPELLILDEPLHGLDETNRRLAIEIIETFCSRKNKSLIFVTHYKEELPRSITHSLHLLKSIAMT
ncbi:MAG: ATP-binding cassette domain-containing protein [Rikenellaceae bacterium]